MRLQDLRLPGDLPGMVREMTTRWRQLVDWSKATLQDVDTTGAVNGSMLAFTAADGIWRPVTPPTSGTYTPTLANVANCAALTAYQAQWMRVGNTVTVAGGLDIDPTTASTLTKLTISLPVASSFTLTQNCGGTAAMQDLAGTSARIYANAGAGNVILGYLCGTDVANRGWSFTFTYLVQ